MTRFLTALTCFALFVTSYAATDADYAAGNIEKQGYDLREAVYENILSSPEITAQNLPPASAIRINPLISSQMIFVGLENGRIGNVNMNNIEEACRAYLESSGLINSGFELGAASKKFVMDKVWFVTFQKTINGAPVLDGGIKLAVSPEGRVNFLMGDFGRTPSEMMSFNLPENSALDIAAGGLAGSNISSKSKGRAVLPIYFQNKTEYHPVYHIQVRAEAPYSEWDVFVDAENGTILQRKSSMYYDNVSGNISGSIQPLTPFDPWEDRNFYDHNLEFGIYGTALTDMDGNYAITIPNNDPIDVEAWLRGPFLQVNNSNGPAAYISQNIIPSGTYDVYWEDSNSDPAERCAWRNAVYIHNWIKTLDPNLTEMDFPMGCNVNVNGSCNAFWSGQSRTINFYRQGGGCPNIAQIADVVYHEYGHGITDLQYRPYAPNGAMHEGFSDYLACTVTNQPHVGLGFNGPGTYLRNVDNTMRYPENWIGESHNDGLIISGAIWDTREELSMYPMGYTDSLWHFAREAHPPNFEEYFWAFLTMDDDDGNINNGTPNAGVIFHAFGDLHGIGPGSVVIISADSLYDSEDTTNAYEVHADVMAPFSPLSDSVLLYYDIGNGFSPVNMVLSQGQWVGEIPPQSYGTTVNYYILAVDEGGFRGTDPENAPSEFFTFYVGPDMIEPTLTFIEGPPNTVNLFGPYGTFIISAWDINGINPNSVYLHYFVNSGAENEVLMSSIGNDGEFEYAALDIGQRLNSGDIVHYYFTAEDGANNPNTGRNPATGSLDLIMSQTEEFEGFEEVGIDNWNTEGAWALFSQGHNGGQSMIFGPSYPDNASDLAYMDYSYDMSPYGQANITLYHKNVILDGDTCFVLISNNGGSSWFTAGSITGFSGSSYIFDEYDISEALSIFAHDYRIGFRFVSDGSGSSIGVMIDDIGWSVGEMTGVDENNIALPEELSLSQNYPNPFNPRTSISFGLPNKSAVVLDVYDLLGRKIAKIVDGELEAGHHSIIWDGKDGDGNSVSSGIYFYRLVTEYGVKQAKMTLLK